MIKNILYYEKYCDPSYWAISKYREIDPKDIQISYVYKKSINVPQIFTEDYLCDFIKLVLKIKYGPYKTFEESCKHCKISNFTKLPHLYKALLTEQSFRFPIVSDVNLTHICSGAGRVLIISNYFPDKKVDVIFNRTKDDPESNHNLSDLVSDIVNNDSWKDIDLSNSTLFLDFYKKDIQRIIGIEIAYQEYKKLELKDKPEPGVFLTLRENDFDLWKRMYPVIMSTKCLTFNDYQNLLDRLVLDNVEYVMNDNVDWGPKPLTGAVTRSMINR